MSSPLLKEIGMANGFDNSQDRAEISGILPNHQDDEDIDNDDKIYTTNLEYQLRQKSRRLRQDRQPQKLPSPGGRATSIRKLGPPVPLIAPTTIKGWYVPFES